MLRYRSVFISDVHLGTRDCQAEFLLDFLRSIECDRLYLVGDIIDFWAMRKSVYWTEAQSAVVQTILSKAQDGNEVVYIPGNHDALLRDYCDAEFNGVKLRRQAAFCSMDGRRFRVSHGDEFDAQVKHNLLTKFIGDNAYMWLLGMNRWSQSLRARFGFKYWSLAGFLKTRMGKVNRHIRRFEEAAAQRARFDHYDGFICGHIHKPGIRDYAGILYCNDGDWVETCSALVEDEFGNLQLLHWSDHQKVQQIQSFVGGRPVDSTLRHTG